MNSSVELTNAIASLLATEAKAQDLPKACVRFGLADGTDEDAFRGKARYISTRLQGKDLDELMGIGGAVLESYDGFKRPVFQLREALRHARSQGVNQITEITRTNLCQAFAALGNLTGQLSPAGFIRKLWPIGTMPSEDFRFLTFDEELVQHTVRNDDWSTEDVLGRLQVSTISDEAFGELLAMLVHPTVRQGDEQQTWLQTINTHIGVDRFILRESARISGHPVYLMGPIEAGVQGAAKNLIFASSGPKPEIVLIDAVNNDVRVVRNEQFCLFYNDRSASTGYCGTTS